ncbi:MAG: MFS transporter [Candidatus Heimdallarchaeota archaeon]
MLTFKEKSSYGIGRLGSSITINMADLFTGYVYFAFFGLEEDPFLAFFGVAIGKIVIAFTSYGAGYLSDRTYSRSWGRRRPFILIGAPLLAISFFLLYSPHLFLPPGSDPMVIFGYLLTFNTLYQGLYGFLLTPFQAWMPEITTEKERLEVSGYQNTVNLIAFVIGAGSSFLLPALLGGSSESINLTAPNGILPFLSNGLVITTLIGVFAFAVVVFFIPSLINIRAKEVFIPQPSIREELNVIFGNRNYLWWTISRGLLSVGLSIIMGIILSWIDKALRFGTLEYIIFGLTLLLTIFAGFYWWGKYGNREGKTRSFIYSTVWMIIFAPFASLVGQIQFVSEIIPIYVQALVFVVFAGVGVAGFYLLPYAIVADIVEEDERRTGESRGGMYYGFESIPLNFFQFIGYLIVGVLLQSLPLFTDWQGHQYSLGFLLWGPVAAVFILCSVLIFWQKVNADPLRGVAPSA